MNYKNNLNFNGQKLEKELQGESLDFIFIDGDHTYEGVKSDFTNYKKYLKYKKKYLQMKYLLLK